MLKSAIVTAIGSFSADCVINTLHTLGVKVTGTDIFPQDWHYEASLCDEFYQAPLATEHEKYIDFLINVARRTGAEAIIPLTDLEIDVIAGSRERFVHNGIRLFMQPDEVLAVARDKYELYLHFKGNPLFSVPVSIATPCNVPAEVSPSALPLIAKPRDGRSSEGLSTVRTERQLIELSTLGNHILQEYKSGPVFTVDYVRDCLGNDAAIAREELLRTKNGAGMTVRITPDPVFREMTSFIGESLGIVGCVNMEFILSDGEYYLIDINPRFSAGVAFSELAGYHMVSAAIEAYEGRAIPPAIIPHQAIMQKRLTEIVNRMA